MDNLYDVIVVGAGLSGLSAAKNLTDMGLKVLVVEARDRIGGQVYTIKTSTTGLTLNMGADHFSRDQKRLMQLIKKIGLEVGKVSFGKNAYQDSASSEAITLTNDPINPKFKSIFNKIDFTFGLLKLFFLSRKIRKKIDKIWEIKGAQEMDETPLSRWFEKNMFTEDALNEAKLIFRRELMDPEYFSLLDMIHFFGTAESFLAIYRGEEYCLPSGLNQISKYLESFLKNPIELNSPVDEIHVANDSVEVKSNSKSWKAKYVIIAMSRQLYKEIKFNPPLSKQHLEILKKESPDYGFKLVLIYEKPFWRKKFSGSSQTKRKLIWNTIDVSDGMNGYGVLECYSSGTQALEATNWTKEERLKKTIEQLSEYFGPEIKNVIESYEVLWSNEKYTKANFGLGFIGTFLPYKKIIAENFGRVQWASSGLADDSRMCMEGALISGETVSHKVYSLIMKDKKI